MRLKSAFMGALILVLMLGSLVAPVVAAGQGSQQTKSEAKKKHRVLILIEVTNNTIKRTLEVAESYNITLPSDVQAKLDNATELLSKAASLVDTDPDQAFTLVKQAMRLAREAAIYVYSHLDEEVKDELKARGLERAIENQLEFIGKVEEFIEKLEAYNVTVPEELKQRLERARNILEEALELLPQVENGTMPAAVVAGKIGDAKLIVASVIRDLNRGVIVRIAFKARMVEAHVNCIARIVIHLERAINHTIRLIESNETGDALELINATLRQTLHAINTTSRMIELVETRNIGNENLTAALETLKAGLENVSQYLEEAYQALKAGDKASAIMALEAAAEQIDETLSKVSPYLAPFRHRVEIMLGKVRHMRIRLGEAFETQVKRGKMMLVMGLKMMENRLKRLYQAYQNGNLTEDQWRQIAARALRQLEILEEHLERLRMNRGPLANMIDQVQSWLLGTLG